MPATIRLDTHFNVGAIDPRLYGGFLEHLGRAVYGGVYEPGSPLADAAGFRRDVLDALRPLAMPVVRYPGGNFVSAYDWRDGVGPVEKRPRRRDYAWQSTESNRFGTDEFMRWCAAAGTAPMMAVNLGTAGAKEAAELLEYCNLPAGTPWADQRVANGHAEPYGVKLWCLGNEMDGPWQAGHVPAGVYAQRAFQAAFLMKGLDPSIQLIAAGSSARSMPTYPAWDREVIDFCWPTADYLSAHRYSANANDDAAWYLAEGVEIDATIREYAALFAHVAAVRRSDKRMYLSFDEWNVWYRERDRPEADRGRWREAPPLLEERYNVEDALVVAQYLAAFVRRADVVKIACLAQIVNVIAPVVTRPDGLFLQTIYHPFLAFSRHGRGTSLTPIVQAPTYRAGARGEVPSLDVAASFDAASDDVSVFATARHAALGGAVEVRLDDRAIAGVVEATQLSGGLKLANDFDARDRVTMRPFDVTVADGVARFTMPTPGFACVRLRTTPR